MGGGLGRLVGTVVTKGCVAKSRWAVGVHGEYLAISICVICWLIWFICVGSEVIYASLVYSWFLIWDLELTRLEIYVSDEFIPDSKYEAALLIMYSLSSTVATVSESSELKSV